jgi:xanthine dehydrogenase YagR molybdenum-binding subunit
VQFAEAQVDVETGIVKVTRILAIQDCGLIVDRLTAESQAYGGVVASINFALFEDRLLDRSTGQMVNPNMEWYMLGRHVGRAEDRHRAQQHAGARRHRHRRAADRVDGIGDRERGRNATGATIRSLPLHPHKVLAALEQERAGGTL